MPHTAAESSSRATIAPHKSALVIIALLRLIPRAGAMTTKRVARGFESGEELRLELDVDRTLSICVGGEEVARDERAWRSVAAAAIATVATPPPQTTLVGVRDVVNASRLSSSWR